MPMDHRVVNVAGHAGAGKTTLVRALVEELGGWTAVVRSGGKNVTCPFLESDGIVVFGRWEGHHAVSTSGVAGRLDGCDRLHWNARVLAGRLLSEFKRRNVRLVICDGPRLTTPKFREAAAKAGYAFDTIVVACSHRNSDRKIHTREAGTSWQDRTWHLPTGGDHRRMKQSEVLAELRYWAAKARGRPLPGGRARRGRVRTATPSRRVLQTTAKQRRSDAARKAVARAKVSRKERARTNKARAAARKVKSKSAEFRAMERIQSRMAKRRARD